MEVKMYPRGTPEIVISSNNSNLNGQQTQHPAHVPSIVHLQHISKGPHACGFRLQLLGHLVRAFRDLLGYACQASSVEPVRLRARPRRQFVQEGDGLFGNIVGAVRGRLVCFYHARLGNKSKVKVGSIPLELDIPVTI